MKYYDPELKARVVKEVEETGNLTVAARKYDIPLSTIEGWRKRLNFNGSHSISRKKDEKKILLDVYDRSIVSYHIGLSCTAKDVSFAL